MKFDDLLDMTLGEVLEEYSLLANLECGYIYGIASYDDITRMLEEYDVSQYSEAMSVEPIIEFDTIWSNNGELIEYEKIKKIMDILAIPKKEQF